MKKLLASLKLIKEHYMYMVTLVCLDCGDSSQMVEVEIFRDRPDAVEEVRAYMVGVFKINEARCRTCKRTNLAFSINTLRSTDYRRLWGLAFVLVILAIIGTSG